MTSEHKEDNYGQPAQPANFPPAGVIDADYTLKGLIHKMEVAENPSQGAVPWFMCSLIRQSLPYLKRLDAATDAQPTASVEPVGEIVCKEWDQRKPKVAYLNEAGRALPKGTAIYAAPVAAQPSLQRNDHE